MHGFVDRSVSLYLQTDPSDLLQQSSDVTLLLKSCVVLGQGNPILHKFGTLFHNNVVEKSSSSLDTLVISDPLFNDFSVFHLLSF